MIFLKTSVITAPYHVSLYVRHVTVNVKKSDPTAAFQGVSFSKNTTSCETFLQYFQNWHIWHIFYLQYQFAQFQS